MALKKSEIYICSKGTQLEVLLDSEGCNLLCCGEPMTVLEEKTADAATEKHVPVIETIDGGVKVTVGSTLHPMVEDHYIEWIEVQTASCLYRKYLAPGDAPEAIFKLD